MEVDMGADMGVNMVAYMMVDMLANMKVDMMANMLATKFFFSSSFLKPNFVGLRIF